MNVVLDANVYVSALISQFGNPHQIVQRWLAGEFEVQITSAILDEVGRVLRYPRIVRRHRLTEADVARFLDLLGQYATWVEPTVTLQVIAEDESDNRYLECVVTGKAEYVITGDDHLLALQSIQGVYILSPAEFMAVLATPGRGT